ncbi:DNA processing protein DprA [Defluviimonas aquaemixtae]|uniref:DNA processing protein DprA n=1 Tax=Albidovulum aquaemixtae TaxID=1542388 RepID=A0A2R8BNF3_9RHOB|nr:DNA-processing protein DprA [Defluviimonas aquaemixtae]SPH24979.1 DNA processing protein DprA [Defluviimonas aquaemixtae]
MFSYPTPFTPPTTEDDRLSWLRLIRSHRVGVATFWRLIEEHGSAEAALLALPEIAKAAGVEAYKACPEGVALSEHKAGKSAGARLLCRGEPAYPHALADISDAPPVLWVRGDTGLLARPMVALVGARSASSLGTRMARKLAEGLGAAGVTVVSGLARGVDAAAHAAALPTGTVAVMAGGVDVVYPAENTGLAGEVAAKGLMLSEQPIGLDPLARHFPMRNRIVAGLSRAVVVVEAAHRSGSLITARIALEQGREVLAVPGHPFDGRAAGCNMLIRDGATLVRGADDVLAALSEMPGGGDGGRSTPRAASAVEGAPAPARTASAGAPVAPPNPPRQESAALHDRILDRLGPSPVAEDQLIRDLALPAASVAEELIALELDGRVQRQPGGLLSRVD